MGTYRNGKYEIGHYVKDKVIVITGASSGFGAATAKKAAYLGAKVVMAARREDRLRSMAESLTAEGCDVRYIATDVRQQAQVEAMIQFAISEFGRIDVLINDAGTMPQSFFADHAFAMEAWEECMDTALKGTLYGISAVYDQMIQQERGHIINVSSILGNTAVNGSGVYNVSKVGVRFLAESLRVETRGKIKVTTIRPSSVSSTELNGTIVNIMASMAGMYGKLFDAMGRPASPDLRNRESIRFSEPTADDIADNIIYAIDQPWGVDISDITVRASGESMFV